MNVEQLLRIPEFQQFRLIAGNPENGREITSVNVIDSPDSYKFFKGGEFLLTNTYIMREDISILRDITVACANIGVCAIGIKLARFVQELPEAYIALANALGFPVILIPVEFAFESIISRVYAEIVNNQLSRLMYSEKVHTSFTQLVLEGGPIHKILQNLTELIKSPTCYYDTFFEQFYSSEGARRIPLVQAPLPLAQALERYPYYLLDVCETKYGYLVVESPARPEGQSGHVPGAYAEIAIQHASTVIKLTAQREISNWQIESRHRDEFIQGLLLNSFDTQQEIDAKKGLYGWKFEAGVIAVVIDAEESTWNWEGKELDFLIRRKLRKLYPDSMYTKLGAQLVFLLEPMESASYLKGLEKSFALFVQEMEREYPLTIHVGIGERHATLRETHLSYQEAQVAEQIGRRLQQRVSCYENLGLYQLLAKVNDSRCVEGFLDKYAGKLAAYDRQHNSEYFKTLQCLVANDWNLQKASESLYVHYNTLKNRYYKMGRILEEDLHDPDVKMCLMISLKLYHLDKRREPGAL